MPRKNELENTKLGTAWMILRATFMYDLAHKSKSGDKSSSVSKFNSLKQGLGSNTLFLIAKFNET